MAAIQSPSQDTVRKDSVHAQEGYNWQTDYSNDSRRAKVLQAPTCSNPGAMASAPRKTKRKDDSLSYMIRQHIVNHQLGEYLSSWTKLQYRANQSGLSINCLALLTLTHVLFPSLRSFTTPFFTLSHQDHKTGEYHPGTDDFKFVSLWIIIFTGLRAGTMDYVLTPWARSLGLAKKKTIVRFSEQGWMLIYYCIFWSLGMVRSKCSGPLDMADNTTAVPVLHFRLLCQPPSNVEPIPEFCHDRTFQILLPGAICFLAPADCGCTHRRPKERSLADVHPPYHNELAYAYELWMVPDKSRQRDTLHHGCG